MLGKKWNKRFIDLCDHISQWSKDKSTKVGAVIVNRDRRVISIGYNGFPQNINDNIERRHERPAKYDWTEHAERNAIYTAARNQSDLRDCFIFSNYFPCPDCTSAIIQCGLSGVVYKHLDVNGGKNSESWKRSKKISKEMLTEAGIIITQYEEK